MPSDDSPSTPPADPPDGAAAPVDAGEPLPPLLPFHTQPAAERPLPRGCHPLVFGVVMATLQMAALWYFMPSCFGRPS